jgi:3-hydroxy-9,10-secoandrosta-1,3,5(10)-triene-9,17-dione monooxygenase
MYCLGATHALAATSLFDEQAQREIFRVPDFIAPATIVPSGYATRLPDGG